MKSLSHPYDRLLRAGLAIAIPFSIILNIAVVICQLDIIYNANLVYRRISDELPRELPIELHTVNGIFHDDPEHYAMAGAQADAEWNSMQPAWGGYVFLNASSLPYAVSMWHQMHCLNRIRTALSTGDDEPEHTGHCFHYLRHAILCAADTTLEPTVRLPRGIDIIKQNNATHTCRDWRQVYDYVQEQHGAWTPDMKALFLPPGTPVEPVNVIP